MTTARALRSGSVRAVGAAQPGAPRCTGRLLGLRPGSGVLALEVGTHEPLELLELGGLADQHVLGDGVELAAQGDGLRSEEHTSELQSRGHLVCRLLLEK